MAHGGRRPVLPRCGQACGRLIGCERGCRSAFQPQATPKLKHEPVLRQSTAAPALPGAVPPPRQAFGDKHVTAARHRRFRQTAVARMKHPRRDTGDHQRRNHKPRADVIGCRSSARSADPHLRCSSRPVTSAPFASVDSPSVRLCRSPPARGREPVAGNTGGHVLAPEIDRASAPQRRVAGREHDLLVAAHLRDLVRQDQRPA
ncbi:hypothetical protein SAMN05444123_11545 [Rhodopseudomonas pseudopalustris]|uniref:Uncharacterized protein n=1 Tax=Rhodopseudomonas pseudopalustris TaxID=1513892 RepID=A0A1H8X0V5_9BRAD|nr:hypothetical protein SAMN05444123_11545 [Rhodopseudomonas pseudopalustris]